MYVSKFHMYASSSKHYIYYCSKHPYFWGSPTADPELSYVYKQGKIISKCVIKKLQKYNNLFLILVTGKLFTNVYVINTCFAEIAASNLSFSSDM